MNAANALERFLIWIYLVLKGQIVRSVLEKVLTVRAGKLPGLVTLFSGEESDDGMTNAVYRFFGDAPQVAQSELRHLKVFTATVGKREAASQYYLNDVTVIPFLLFLSYEVPSFDSSLDSLGRGESSCRARRIGFCGGLASLSV